MSSCIFLFPNALLSEEERNQFAVAVIDQSACRIYRAFEKRVAFGIDFIFVIAHLEIEEAYDVYGHDQNDEAAYDIFTFFKFVIFTHWSHPV